jgi:hypothetical protein
VRKSYTIDLTDDPYYGEKKGDYVVGGKRKASTNLFFSYATFYLIDGKRKLTIGVIPKSKNLSLIYYVITFIKIIDEPGVKVKVLCADHEFYTYAVISYLQSAKIPFIVPVKVQGKQMKKLLKVQKSCCLECVMSPQGKLGYYTSMAKGIAQSVIGLLILGCFFPLICIMLCIWMGSIPWSYLCALRKNQLREKSNKRPIYLFSK